MYRLPDGTMVKGVMIFDQNGDPVVISGGGGGGAVSINVGGVAVSDSNPFPTEDQALIGAIATDAGAKTVKVVQIGGHNGANAHTWHVNAQGQGKVINDSLGDPTDAVATTDTGIWSIPSLLKKLNQSLTSLLSRFGTLGQKAMSGSTPVVIASDQSSIPITPRANSSGFGGTTAYKLISAGTTNAQSVKVFSGNLYSIIAINTNASSPRFLKLYNKASAPTVGTDTPIMTIPIPANSQGAGLCLPFSMGVNFSLGIAIAITGGVADNDTTAILANEVVLNLTYA
jgi:hypothetical protein